MASRARTALLAACCATLAACSEGAVPRAPEREAPVASARAAIFESKALDTARAWHTSTLLADGNVLVAGGAQEAGSLVPIARAELYASFAGGFEMLPHMRAARYRHSATRLFDGTVLLAGGFGHDGVGLSSAELFLPDSRTFVSVGEMAGQRGAHTATLLEDGRVLIVGGRGADGAADAATGTEVYDPNAQTFATLPAGPSHPEARNVAVTLADSRVLILWSESRLLELFDPATNGFSAAPPSIGTPPDDIGQIVSATRLGDDSLAIYGTQRVWRTGLEGACKYGQELCNGQCVDLHFDDGHCGSCGTTCGPDQLCVDGNCTCTAPYTACGADCVVLGSDNDDHCGACFNACPGGSFCNIGMNCICDFGCGPNCTVPFDDPENCGTCDVMCGPGQSCFGGQCSSVCPAPRIQCGASCVNTDTDPQNCGGCGIACATSCVSGFCAPECGPDQAACFFGTELGCANIKADNQHCGRCDQSCGPQRECWAGNCWPVSAAPELAASRSAVITRSADAVWMTQNFGASVFKEEDPEVWTKGLQPNVDALAETFGGVGHTTTALPDGSILTVGGLQTPSAARFSTPWRVEELKMATGAVEWAMTMTSAQLPNGHVLFALGTTLFDYDGITLTPLGAVDNGGATVALAPQASGRVLMIGGILSRGTSFSSNITGPLAHVLDPTSGTAQELDLKLSDFGQALTLPSGAVLLGGYSSLDLLRPVGADEFQVDEVPIELGCHQPGLARLPNGHVLVVADKAIYELDLGTLELSEPVSTGLSRCGSTPVVRADGTVLLIGGWDAAAEGYSPAWELYDSRSRTTAPVQSPSENIVNWTLFNWFDAPLLFTQSALNGVRQLNFSEASFDYAILGPDFIFYDTSGPLPRNVRLMPDASLLVENGWSSEPGGGIRTARMSMGEPAPRARFDFQDAPLLHMNDEIDFAATFPNAIFPGRAPEGSSGTTASSSSALPVPVWFPPDGYPTMGALTRVGSEVKLRVPKTPFPGLGLMFLASNGKLTGIGPVTIAPSADGTQCVDAAECDSGHCVDRVCCNEVCDGVCEACSVASSAAEDGVCGFAAAGTREDACEVAPVSTCQQDGKCDGNGGCALYPDGTECQTGFAAACSDGECIPIEVVEGPTCNDNDEAVAPGQAPRDCLEFRCRNGKCLTRCRSNRDCKGGFACTAEGRCETPLDETRVVSCGCRLPLHGRPGLANWLASLFTFAALLRRRRSFDFKTKRRASAP